MKKFVLSILLFMIPVLCQADSLFNNGGIFNKGSGSGGSSQWATSGTNIHNANTGNVGIGSVNPFNPLTVAVDGGAYQLGVGYNSNQGMQIEAINSNNSLNSTLYFSSSSLHFYTNNNGIDDGNTYFDEDGSHKMTITQAGVVSTSNNTLDDGSGNMTFGPSASMHTQGSSYGNMPQIVIGGFSGFEANAAIEANGSTTGQGAAIRGQISVSASGVWSDPSYGQTFDIKAGSATGSGVGGISANGSFNTNTYYSVGNIPVVYPNLITETTGQITAGYDYIILSGNPATDYPYAGTFNTSYFPIDPCSISGTEGINGDPINDDCGGNIIDSFTSTLLSTINYSTGVATDQTGGSDYVAQINYTYDVLGYPAQINSDGSASFGSGVLKINSGGSLNNLTVTGTSNLGSGASFDSSGNLTIGVSYIDYNGNGEIANNLIVGNTLETPIINAGNDILIYGNEVYDNGGVSIIGSGGQGGTVTLQSTQTIGSSSGDYIDFEVNHNDDAMRIVHSGNIGIGTANPQNPLAIVGNVGIGTTNNRSKLQMFDSSGVSWHCAPAPTTGVFTCTSP